MSPIQVKLVGLVAVLLLGVGAQWVAWRVRLSSILLLMAAGIVAGPVTGWLDPERLLGDLLFPIVSISVALILFEGGASLRFSHLREIGRPLTGLLTLGAAVTWVLTVVLAYGLAGLSLPIALVLGSILIVTGPTVIGPLLQHIRPTGRVGTIARWEGIVIDPIGAILAVLVYQIVAPFHSPEWHQAATVAAIGLGKTILAGGLIGAVAALALAFALRRFWVPDYLESSVVLAVVLAAFTASNLIQQESGLLAVTLMGMLVANQRQATVRHILEFKENLRVLLIGSLFILLAARLHLEDFTALGWRGPAFAASLILVVRPVAVFLSTARSDLNWRERLFLAWFAPRGIVAASVSSIFAIRLGAAGAELVPAAFLAILATVLVYGLTALPVARWLGLASENPQGVLIAGAHAGARAIAHALQKAGLPVVLIDNYWPNVNTARQEGLRCHYLHVLSEQALDELDLSGIGRYLGMTRNMELNSLGAMHFRELFGRSEVYQILPDQPERPERQAAAHLLHGRFLFGRGVTYADLDRRFAAGARIKSTKLTGQFTERDLLARYGEDAIVLFIIEPSGKLTVCTADQAPTFQPGQTVLSLVGPEAGGNADILGATEEQLPGLA